MTAAKEVTHIPAVEVVGLGPALPVSTHNNDASTRQQQTVSQAPTLAPSRSSGSDHSNEKLAHQTRSGTSNSDPEKGGFIPSPESSGYSDDEPRDVPIDVEKSKAQFAALSRSMSQQSSLHRARTRQSIRGGGNDVESQGAAAADDDEEEFNLLEHIRGQTARADAEGIKHKKISVVWDHLRVVGGGGIKINIRTFPNAIIEQFMMPVLQLLALCGKDLMATEPKTILHDFNGFLRPGEMCLVLGRPNSGCSTFLKAMTNMRGEYQKVEGTVTYEGIDAQEMKKKYAQEVIYSQEDDIHQPTLTVEQTLQTALRLKTPARIVGGVSRKDFRRQVIDVLLNMLNINETRDTIVGNEFVRGISGGQRKRMSVAEAFCSSGAVIAWDNSTRGLDASSALDFAKSLRILTDITECTLASSLYQAGEGIYEQFDKVLLIDKGHQVYFGPRTEARAYMMGLGFKDKPRQTSADWLTGCTDPNEREYADGVNPADVPSDGESFAKAYLASEMYKRMKAEQEAVIQQSSAHKDRQNEFRQAVQESKRKGVGKTSPYTVSFFTQVWALFIRQLTLKLQDKLSLYAGYFTAIAIALISGSLFYQLPLDASGAFTRGGTLFIAMLFNALNAFSELPSQMMGRPITYKQVAYRFYRPGALAVAQTLADFPFNALQIFIFILIIYFMSGLYASAGAFFTTYLFVFSTFLTMSAFFRVLGTATHSYDVAARLASVLISFMVIYAGYMIPYAGMKKWIGWVYWINPLSYGFESLMINEFMRIDLACNSAYIIPRNYGTVTTFPSTVTTVNQVCTLPGSIAGQNAVVGMDYLSASFGYARGHLWRNFGILVAFFLFFTGLQILAMEFLVSSAANVKAIVVFAKENKDTRARNARLAERKEDLASGKIEQNVASLVASKKPFTWENLTYTVPVSGGHRQLLDNVFGYCLPGSLVALMGASGAGKTTLLDVLAARKTVGVIGGDVKVNGREPDITFQKGTAYVEQQDVHEWTTTVREAMRISAYLRQPNSTPVSEKDDYVEEIIELLEMQDLADAMIGFPGYGLSVEARKRLTIGVELAAKPELLLFLDEPTSGLDGQSAFNIVRFLRKLAAAGQAILCTIHQPNAILFENFDRLLLLQRGGQTVYFGDVGKDSHVLVSYLERNGAPVPPSANPAEFMLDAIGAGSGKMLGDGTNWHQKWLNSPELAKVKEEIVQMNNAALNKPDEKSEEALRQYATPFIFQLRTILGRTNTALWRNADYQWTRLFSHMAIAIVAGLTWLQLDNSLTSLQYRVFAVFMVTVMPALILAQIEPQFIMSRNTYYREASSKMYSPTVFAISQMLAEMPYSLLCAVGFFIPWYYIIGLPSASSRAGYVFLMILITEVFSVTLGQLIAALTPSIPVASLFNPFMLVILSLFCGVTQPPSTMTYFWRVWMYPLDPFTRLVGGLIVSLLHDVPVVCETNEYYTFDAPTGQTCGAYAGGFATSVGAYIANGDATGACQYCSYSVGDSFYAGLELSYGNRWRDFGIFVAYPIFNVFATIVAVRFINWAKR